MARLEKIITGLVELFTEYADDQGNKGTLCKDELQAMLEKEIASETLKAKLNVNDIKEVMETLDKDGDEEITFQEFCRCVTRLGKHYRKEVCRKQKKDKDKA